MALTHGGQVTRRGKSRGGGVGGRRGGEMVEVFGKRKILRSKAGAIPTGEKKIQKKQRGMIGKKSQQSLNTNKLSRESGWRRVRGFRYWGGCNWGKSQII